MNNKVYLVHPIIPPTLEYKDGLLTPESYKSLWLTMLWYKKYTDLYLKPLLDEPRYENAKSLENNFGWEGMHV